METILEETPTSGQLLTEDERRTLSLHFDRTEEALLVEVRDLSDAEWRFKPTDDTWSIANIVEHLVVIEETVHGVVEKMEHAPPADPGRSSSIVDQYVMTEAPNRANKLIAPAMAQPQGRYADRKSIEFFVKGRARTREIFETTPYLRGRLLPHPMFGLWDGYQWLLATSAHTERHTEQIRELKTHPAFPPR